jgi:hypothetical protein
MNVLFGVCIRHLLFYSAAVRFTTLISNYRLDCNLACSLVTHVFDLYDFLISEFSSTVLIQFLTYSKADRYSGELIILFLTRHLSANKARLALQGVFCYVLFGLT